MAQTQLVQTRIDGRIKAEASAALAEMGLTVSDAVRVLLTKIAKEKSLPTGLFIPNATTMAAFHEAETTSLQKFTSIDALLEDLDDD